MVSRTTGWYYCNNSGVFCGRREGGGSGRGGASPPASRHGQPRLDSPQPFVLHSPNTLLVPDKYIH